MTESIIDVFADVGHLISVAGSNEFALPATSARPVEQYDEITLRFARRIVTIAAHGDDDTILLKTADSLYTHRVELTERTPWNKAIGSEITWVWTMTNQNGYFDGLQLEFRTPERYASIQFMCEASSITPRDVRDLSEQI